MNIIIVEDSRLARNELREMLKAHSDVEVIAEAENVQQGIQLIDHHKPDLLLLDIHLPDGDGFQLLEQLQHVPQVIFTTAYDQHALRAFQVNALDYLLKPIEPERLQTALQKVRQNAVAEADTVIERKGRQDQLFIRDGEHCHFVRLGEVALFEVEGNYTRVHFRDQKPLLARSLGYLEQRLDPSVFFRANRQELINFDYIQRIEPGVGEGYIVTMKNGREIQVSRRQAKELRDHLEW